MEKTTAVKIKLWSEIALSVITVAVGIFFIAAVADIYYSKTGDVMYSREIAGDKLLLLIAPIAVWIVAIIGCFVLSVIFPDEEKKSPPASAGERVKRLRSKVPAKGKTGFEEEYKKYRGFALGRIIFYGVASAFAVAAAIITIVYLATTSKFGNGEINPEILELVKHTLPFIAASFLLFVGAALYEHFTAKYELACITKLLVLGRGEAVESSRISDVLSAIGHAVTGRAELIVMIARIVVFVTAAVFIGLGIANGGVIDVLYKAINICTECIGLG